MSSIVSSMLTSPQLKHLPETIPSADESVRRQVWGVLWGLYPRGGTTERRNVQRVPYPQLLYLTPAGDDLLPDGDPIAVIGKHLSEQGLGFYHVEPLPFRRMIASLQLSRSEWAGFLIDIKWTCFTRFGWYDSGGQFLRTVPSPIAEHTT